MIVGATGEDSAAPLWNRNQQNDDKTKAAAAYHFRALNAAWRVDRSRDPSQLIQYGGAPMDDRPWEPRSRVWWAILDSNQ